MNILDLSNNNLVDIKDNKIKCIGILNLQNNKLTEFNINNMFNGI
jgi:Leucine-rich repeat (LRR) protein